MQSPPVVGFTQGMEARLLLAMSDIG